MTDSPPKDAPRRSGKIAAFIVFGIALAASLAILFWARKGPPEHIKHPEGGSVDPFVKQPADAKAPAPAPTP